LWKDGSVTSYVEKRPASSVSEVVKFVRGHAKPASGRPLEQLGLVKTVLVPDAMSGDAAVPDPPNDVALGDTKDPRCVIHRELHRSPLALS
jgi:hypothetical protein